MKVAFWCLVNVLSVAKSSVLPKRCEILLLHTFPVPQGKETGDSWFRDAQGFGMAARKISLSVKAIQ